MRKDLSEQASACRQKAAECERRALLVDDANHRSTYLELAEMWREMARHGERLNDLFAEPKQHASASRKASLPK